MIRPYLKFCLLAVLCSCTISIALGQHTPQSKTASMLQNQIILKLKPSYQFNISENKKSLGLPVLDDIASQHGTYKIEKFGQSIPKTPKKNRPNFNQIVVLIYDNDINVESAIKAFEASKLLEYAEPNGLMYGSSKIIEDKMKAINHTAPMLVPNEQYYDTQWWSKNNGTYHNGGYSLPDYFPNCVAGADISLEPAWDITTGCSSVVIALLDTGMKMDHPEVAGRIIGGYDFINNDNDPSDDQGHGSNVGGICFANGNDGGIHAGVNWNSKVLIVKVLDENNYGLWVDIADGVIWAVDNGASIINMSIGGTSPSQILQDAVQYAYANDIPVIVSAGNDNQNIPNYPASYPQTISVGATTCNDARVNNSAWGSNYHNTVDLVAPGSSIYGLRYNGDNFGYWFGGTSQATPMVTGVASLLLSINPNLTVEDIRTILRNTADDQVGDPSEDIAGYDIHHGAGRLNAHQALLALTNAGCTIGDACSDGDDCTVGETYDVDCQCTGGSLLDENDNGLCDITEPSSCGNSATMLTVEDANVYVTDPCNGVILTAPNGNCFKLTVDNNGGIITEAVPCPSF